MKKCCIICREETDSFSDEHLIQGAHGVYYHIYTVCENYNSKLGLNVGSKLVNHHFSNFQRFLLGQRGYTGRLPNPSREHQFSEVEGKKVQLKLDKDDKHTPYTITNVSYEE